MAFQASEQACLIPSNFSEKNSTMLCQVSAIPCRRPSIRKVPISGKHRRENEMAWNRSFHQFTIWGLPSFLFSHVPATSALHLRYRRSKTPSRRCRTKALEDHLKCHAIPPNAPTIMLKLNNKLNHQCADFGEDFAPLDVGEAYRQLPAQTNLAQICPTGFTDHLSSRSSRPDNGIAEEAYRENPGVKTSNQSTQWHP